VATVIASQAMISGIFSIIYQGITTNMLPRLHIEYTSRKLMSQIYIPLVNWFLLIFVLIVITKFKYSHNLANAYGLAASGTMTITAIFLTWIFIAKRNILKAIVAFFILFINCLFLLSNLYKIPSGGYWSLLIACLPLSLIIIYTTGQRKLYKSLHPLPLAFFLEKYRIVAEKIAHIRGTAVFLAKNIDKVPTYIASTMFTNNIIYENNVIVTVKTQDRPFGIDAAFVEDLAPGLRVFEIKAGYNEILKIEKIFHTASINPKVIFYGVEDLTAKNLIWKIYIIIKKLTPSFVQFYKLPFNKLHGVTVRIDL
jgi:KUP system potassium uptake protein